MDPKEQAQAELRAELKVLETALEKACDPAFQEDWRQEAAQQARKVARFLVGAAKAGTLQLDPTGCPTNSGTPKPKARA
jgi:hypothetical protein